MFVSLDVKVYLQRNAIAAIRNSSVGRKGQVHRSESDQSGSRGQIFRQNDFGGFLARLQVVVVTSRLENKTDRGILRKFDPSKSRQNARVFFCQRKKVWNIEHWEFFSAFKHVPLEFCFRAKEKEKDFRSETKS